MRSCLSDQRIQVQMAQAICGSLRTPPLVCYLKRWTATPISSACHAVSSVITPSPRR